MKIKYILATSLFFLLVACSQGEEKDINKDLAVAGKSVNVSVKVDLLIDERGQVIEVVRAKGNNNPLSLSPLAMKTLQSQTFPIKHKEDGSAQQYWLRGYEVVAAKIRAADGTNL